MTTDNPNPIAQLREVVRLGNKCRAEASRNTWASKETWADYDSAMSCLDHAALLAHVERLEHLAAVVRDAHLYHRCGEASGTIGEAIAYLDAKGGEVEPPANYP